MSKIPWRLRAVKNDDKTIGEGWGVAYTDGYTIEAVGMRASEVCDADGVLPLPDLLAAAPRLLAALESVALRNEEDGPCFCAIRIPKGEAHHLSCQNARAAISATRGAP
jgi:hypothetical protein